MNGRIESENEKKHYQLITINNKNKRATIPEIVEAVRKKKEEGECLSCEEAIIFSNAKAKDTWVRIWPGTCILATKDDEEFFEKIEKMQVKTWSKRKGAVAEIVEYCAQHTLEAAKKKYANSLFAPMLKVIECEAICHQLGFEAAEAHNKSIYFKMTVKRMKEISAREGRYDKPVDKLTIIPQIQKRIKKKSKVVSSSNQKSTELKNHEEKESEKRVKENIKNREYNKDKKNQLPIIEIIECETLCHLHGFRAVELSLRYKESDVFKITVMKMKELSGTSNQPLKDLSIISQFQKAEKVGEGNGEVGLVDKYFSIANTFLVWTGTSVLVAKDDREIDNLVEEISKQEFLERYQIAAEFQGQCALYGFNNVSTILAKFKDGTCSNISIVKLCEMIYTQQGLHAVKSHHLYQKSAIFRLMAARMKSLSAQSVAQENRKRVETITQEPEIVKVKKEPGVEINNKTMVVAFNINEFRRIAKLLRGQHSGTRTDCGDLAAKFIDYLLTGREPDEAIVGEDVSANWFQVDIVSQKMLAQVKSEPGVRSEKGSENVEQVVSSVIHRTATELGSLAPMDIVYPTDKGKIDLTRPIYQVDQYTQSYALYTEINDRLISEANNNGGRLCGIIDLEHCGKGLLAETLYGHQIVYVVENGQIAFIDCQQKNDKHVVVRDLSEIANFYDQDYSPDDDVFSERVFYFPVTMQNKRKRIEENANETNDLGQDQGLSGNGNTFFHHQPVERSLPPAKRKKMANGLG